MERRKTDVGVAANTASLFISNNSTFPSSLNYWKHMNSSGTFPPIFSNSPMFFQILIKSRTERCASGMGIE